MASGGIRKLEDAKKCFDNGADSFSKLFDKDQKYAEISEIFGEQAISIMVDYKNDKNGIYISQ